LPDLAISCQNDIPVASGLGSSAAAIAGALFGANMLLGQPLSLDQLVQLAAQIEGHPDNTTPAFLGGCQVVVQEGKRIVYASIPIPQDLKAMLFVPDFSMPTAATRKMLPQQVSLVDAVYNISRTALLVTALATGDLSHLKLATQDRLHQPTRQALFPAMSEIFEAALSAGALGVFLSGGGPTILALAENNEEAIANAMLGAANKAGVKGRTRIAKPSLVGTQVVV
jgi:homoserine kinase